MQTPLSEFQESFKDLILNSPNALDTPPEIIQNSLATGETPLPVRLKIYRNNIIGSLTDVMVATFPTLVKLVGVEFFEGCARAFILDNPPNSGCITFYGAGFAEFLENFKPAAQLLYLPDMARLELAQNNAYYARDDAPLTLEELGAIAPDQLADMLLPPRASVHLLYSPYPLLDIQRICMDEDSEETLNMGGGEYYFMIHRPDLNTKATLLSGSEFNALSQLQRGQSLGDSINHTLQKNPEFDVQNFLQKFITLETFTVFTANTSP